MHQPSWSLAPGPFQDKRVSQLFHHHFSSPPRLSCELNCPSLPSYDKQPGPSHLDSTTTDDSWDHFLFDPSVAELAVGTNHLWLSSPARGSRYPRSSRGPLRHNAKG